MPTAALVLDDVRIALHAATLLRITAKVPPGEVLTVMGPSGSGKSSLLAFLGGFLDSAFTASGRVLLDGEELTRMPASARHLGLLFQDPLLFPHMSVGGNVLFAMPRTAARGRRRRELAEARLAEVSLSGFFDRDPDTLSGGQKTRVALARVLASEPRALLLDEPFSALDQALRRQMRKLVFARAREHRLPVILVTHDPADAAAAVGPVIELEGSGPQGGPD